jgi:chromosome segregation ATPase
MLTAPTDNIKLTDEHLAQIQEGENRLSSIEALITIANRNLKVAKLELERTTKDILLQTEKLATLAPQIETAETKYKDLTDQFNDGQISLKNLNSEIETKTADLATKITELNDREAKISEKEKQLSEQGSALGREKILHENDKATFNSKVAKLKEVISTF